MSVASAAVGFVMSCCGPAHRLISFDVQPRLACPGQNVTVTWEVDGAARLAIVKGTANPLPDQILAAEQPVKSKESRPIKVDQTTTFVIRAVDANQAKDPWQGSKHVDVPVADEQKGVTTTCTGSACSGRFTIHAEHDTAKVVRISAPMLKQSGTATPARVCVTHDSLNGVCIDPGGSLDTSVAAEGEWKLETEMPVGAAPTPPGLSVMVQIACP